MRPDKTEQEETIDKCEIDYDVADIKSSSNNNDTRDKRRINTLSNICLGATCDAHKKPNKAAPERDELLTIRKTRQIISICDSEAQDFNYETTSQDDLPTHTIIEKVSHSGKHIEKIVYFCDVCQRKFKCKNLLEKHVMSHTEDKPISCKLCLYTCKYNSILVQHMRTHTGEKPFVCKLCHRQFTLSGNLVKHMRTHTGEKPFACDLCPYKCAVKYTLLQHMRTHAGERPPRARRAALGSNSRGGVAADASERLDEITH